MKNSLVSALLASLFALTVSAAKPNIVFIYADDMGWTGTSVEMIPGDPRTKSDYYHTPHLEKLAAMGMRFSAGYAPAAMCTPSRAAVLTGKTPAELHITSPGPGLSTNAHKLRSPTQLRALPESETTIAEVLATAGYSSAYFGKWHLGTGNPGQHGFDVHDGSTSNGTPADSGPDNPKDIFGINERAIAFMKKNVAEERPFYVQLFHYAVHGPTATKASSESKFGALDKGKRHKDVPFAGMTWDFDVSIGTVLEEIENLGIADNTYIVFMSDNGGPANERIGPLNNHPLSKGKVTLWEGGLRVPLIIAGPGIAANSHSPETVTGCDLFPTFAEWADVTVPTKIDGSSLASLLNGKTQELDRHVDALLFHFPHYGRGADAGPTTAIIAGDMKLIKDWESRSYKMFNLANDLSESKDLAKSQPEKLKKMIALMNARLQSTNAQVPVVNPDYDPNAPLPERRGPGGRGGAGRPGGPGGRPGGPGGPRGAG